MGVAAGTKEARSETIRLRARGMSWMTIASTLGLSERVCRKYWKEFCEEERPQVEQIDPMEYVIEQFHRYEAMIESLAAIADDSDAPHAARVNAENSKRDAMASQLALLQQVNIVPKNLGTVKIEMDMRFVFQQVIELMRRFGVPPEAFSELRDLMRRSEELVPPVPALLPGGAADLELGDAAVAEET